MQQQASWGIVEKGRTHNNNLPPRFPLYSHKSFVLGRPGPPGPRGLKGMEDEQRKASLFIIEGRGLGLISTKKRRGERRKRPLRPFNNG